MNWIEKVVQANSETESPARFYYWAALSAISAVMKKNVSLNRFTYRLYPNIYVFLMARSGMKKGSPVTLAKALISRVNTTRVISGRNSMPSIIKDLGKTYPLENGTFVKEAHGILLSGELGAFLVKDPDALAVLTDLYDTHAYEKEWINNLKGTGTDKLKSPCLCVLGATNEEHFMETVPDRDVKGGFIARTMIVFSQDRGTPNSLMYPPSKFIDVEELSKHLLVIAQLKGEMTLTTEAKEYYDKWYYPFIATDHNDPTGTTNRLGDHVLKVAMLLSLSDAPDMIIKQVHISEALEQCWACYLGTKRVTVGGGAHALSKGLRLVMKELLTRPDHQIERSKLLQKYWGEIDTFDLDKITETLLNSGAIDVVDQGKHRFLLMTKETLARYTLEYRKIQ